MWNVLCLFILITLTINSSSAGTNIPSMDKISFIIAAKNYSQIDEADKLRVLQILVSFFKTYDQVLHDDLYQNLHALKSMNQNSLSFLASNNCNNFKNISSLTQYRCKNLSANALKKYIAIEKDLDTYLVPILNDFEVAVGKKYANGGSNEVKNSIRKIVIDIKQRLKKFKTIKKLYNDENFKAADTEIKNALLLLGA